MEPYQMSTVSWIITNILSGILIALVITLPLLIVFAAMAAFRRGLKKDREQFEARLLALLEEIQQALLTSTGKT